MNIKYKFWGFRRLLLSILLVVMGQSIYAQRTQNFEFDRVHAVAGKSYYNRLRVLDMRRSKEKLGFLKKGALSRHIDLVTAQPFPKVLTDYYAKMLVQSHVVKRNELAMVLHNIIVEDGAAGQQIATMFLDADFFGSNGDKYYYLGTIDSLYEMSSSTDVSFQLLHGTADKIAEVLSRFSGKQGKDSAKAYAASELEGWRATDRQQYEAYKVAGNLKPGVYYTLEQFLNNTPVDTPIIIYEGTRGPGGYYSTVYYAKAGLRKNRVISNKEAFAVSDGTKLFCSHKYGFSEMKYENDEFYTIQYFTGLGDGSNGKVMMGIMFGVVGAIIDAAINATNPNDDPAKVAYHAKLLPTEKRFIPMMRFR